MVGVPIGEKAMSPTERTRRKRVLDRQREVQSNAVLMEAAQTLLRFYARFKDEGDEIAARVSLMQAERCINASNGDPDAPLIVSVIDQQALIERQKLEYRDVVRHLEEEKRKAGAGCEVG